MSIIDMRQFCIKQLNDLPPCSRKRAGIEHIMQQITKAELAAAAERQRRLFAAMDREIQCEAEAAIDEAMRRDPGFASAGMGIVP